MKNNFTAEERRKKALLEFRDLLAGAAFPLMLMLIFGSTILWFSTSTEDFAIKILILVVGEVLLIGAYVIFGRHNGIAAMRKSVQNVKKIETGSEDVKARLRVGEYALYKGFLIGFISCVPYILVQIIYSAAPNVVCEILLKYAFGWAYYPLSLVQVSDWLNLLWVIPLCCIHCAAYVLGAMIEKKKLNKIAEAQEIKGKYNKK